MLSPFWTCELIRVAPAADSVFERTSLNTELSDAPILSGRLARK
jgi:hypothetical protein